MTKTKTVYVENYGCTSNRHDLEIMLGLLKQAGHRIVTAPSQSDVVIINSCAVKEATQNRMLHRIASMRGKPLIISGCLPKIDLKSIEQVAPDYYAVMDPQSITEISSIVEHADQTTRNLRYFSDKPPVKPTLPKIRLNPFIETVQIAEGCLGDCSYCCAKFARGRLSSFPSTLIVERVIDAISNGAQEIWLTAQDTGAYGKDSNTDLPDLLKRLIQIDGDFKIRLGMMNPNYAITMLDDLCDIINTSRMFKFLHIPIQSGSNKILKDMNRNYQTEQFTDLVKTLRSRIPNLTLSTDIIVGYPTETEKDFQATINLLEETRPDVTNISKYGSRPRTLAAQMNPLPPNIIIERSKRTSVICSKISLESNQRMIGKIQEISITDTAKEGKPVGRTDNYKKVIINERLQLGTKTRVKVTKASSRYLEATALDHSGQQNSCTLNATIKTVQY
jgi:threonylcarbamoyladenosine tRNA methylthiotransferase CDKAL1